MHWSRDAVFYHIYPLGCCGAPSRNDLTSAPVPRLAALERWLDYLEDLGVNALYLGPVFESVAHGYDTVDYFTVDRRLGDVQTLAALGRSLHARGMRFVLDGVFHHVGRDFPAFKDVRANGRASRFRDWFHLDFNGRSRRGDAFNYEGWRGHDDLVKLNVGNPGVREHLFRAVAFWREAFGVDGLRLDAADCLDLDFQRALAAHCRALNPEFWLKGEVIHGDYRTWVNPPTLSSVTNYVAYKGLWSSHNDRNYFELAYSLERQFGPEGTYRDLDLYTFADNHDVDRVASRLRDATHLYPLYALLFTMPGVPSIYYGSEWGLTGKKASGSDAPLRPALDVASLAARGAHPSLHDAVRKFIAVRRRHRSLRHGDYRPLHVARQQFAFRRGRDGETAVVAANAEHASRSIRISLPDMAGARFVDVLNDGEAFAADAGGALTVNLYPCWSRVLIGPA